MEHWRRITTWGATPSFNMGLDEALLESRDATPTLRFYTWSPDTLSLGYFQRYEEIDHKGRAGALVRRITGGGAIHHARELTFSIAAPADHALYRGPVSKSYERVHGAIAEALETVGVHATLRGDRALRSDVPGSTMCFHESTPLDLVWDDAKGVGSAQRRKLGRVLHHGSIKLGTTELEGPIATLGGEVSEPELADVLRATMERLWDVRLDAAVPDEDERRRALELGVRYGSAAFLRRR